MCHDWHKRGLLLAAEASQPWARSHAALPVADVIDSGQVDLYYSPRDKHGRAACRPCPDAGGS